MASLEQVVREQIEIRLLKTLRGLNGESDAALSEAAKLCPACRLAFDPTPPDEELRRAGHLLACWERLRRARMNGPEDLPVAERLAHQVRALDALRT